MGLHRKEKKGAHFMRRDGKVAFITGAGMGVGRATCLLFAAEGSKIVAADINQEAGEETVRLIRERGGQAVFVGCDVANELQVKEAIAAGVKAFGRLDILYNNAGVLWRDRDFEVTRTNETAWDKVMAINLKMCAQKGEV
jgi:NAD(P)-dependent dehydrogenase (short-subunit alcohol dehydrogenase family)